MRSKSLFFMGVIVVVALVMFYSLSDQSLSSDYAAQIEKQREEKNTFFKQNSQSPLSSSQKEVFEALAYFPPDVAYRVEAIVERLSAPELVNMQTSTGTTQPYTKHARVTFKLQGKTHILVLLKALRPMPGQSSKTVFLPFTDASSGRETYGAGRYLDLELGPQQTTLSIDFNLAYNPYCAYNDVYECPIPPAENYMDAPVLAGEKTYKP